MFVFQTWLHSLDIQGVGRTDTNGVVKTEDPEKAAVLRKNPFLREITGALEAAKEVIAKQEEAPVEVKPMPKKRGRPPKVVVGMRTSEVMEHEGEGE